MTEPSYPADQASSLEPGRGTLILTLGILSLAICALIGPFAWMMGKADLEKMSTGRMDNRDQGITKGGMICGIIATILLCISIVIFLFMLVVGGISAGM